MAELALEFPDVPISSISPYLEMGAYEVLWSEPKATFRSLSKRFAKHPDCVPSNFVYRDEALRSAAFVKNRFEQAGVKKFGVQVYGTSEYPAKLRDAAYPLECFYYQGRWDLAFSRSVAVVGSRKASTEGLACTKSVVRALVRHDYTIVSGLAAGIDRRAHETAIEEKGRTVAVIGTPLSHAYPKENADLQKFIAKYFLVVSQVPLQRYESQDYRRNRFFFPERNVTMSALTEATVIVEAGETSGTLIQARAALKQNRKLFILDRCFRNSQLSWPEKFAAKGAVRVKNINDILQKLATQTYKN